MFLALELGSRSNFFVYIFEPEVVPELIRSLLFWWVTHESLDADCFYEGLMTLWMPALCTELVAFGEVFVQCCLTGACRETISMEATDGPARTGVDRVLYAALKQIVEELKVDHVMSCHVLICSTLQCARSKYERTRNDFVRI